MNSHSQSNDKIGDYCDATQYKTSSLFKEDPCALQIQLFFDELEICNPLGSNINWVKHVHVSGSSTNRILDFINNNSR